MRLDKLHLENFGRFSDFTLELSDGMNLLSAPNEWGKSTLTAFIRFIFYGMPKLRGKPELSEYDRLRFTPWDSERPVSGSLEFTLKGRRIRIERTMQGQKDRVTVLDAVTGRELERTLADEPGVEYLGVDGGTFDRTVFVRQSGVTVTAWGELETRIRNLVTTGDEEISYDKAAELLAAAIRPLAHKRGGGGLVGTLEQEIDRLESQLVRSREVYDEHFDTLRELERLGEEKRALEQDISRLERELQSCSYAAARQKLERLKILDSELEVLRGMLRRTRDRFAGSGGQPDRQAVSEIRRLAGEADAAQQRLELLRNEEATRSLQESKLRGECVLFSKIMAAGGPQTVETQLMELSEGRRGGPWPLFTAGAFLASVLLIVLGFLVTDVLLYAGLGLLLVAGALLWFTLSRKQDASRERYSQSLGFDSLQGLLHALSACRTAQAQMDQLTVRKNELAEAFSAAQAAAEQALFSMRRACGLEENADLDAAGARECASRMESALSEVEDYERRIASVEERQGHVADGASISRLEADAAMAPEGEVREAREVESELAESRSRLFQLERRENALKLSAADALRGIPIPAQLTEQLSEKREQLDRARGRLAALTLAADTLKEAFDELQHMLAPRLNEAAGALFSRFTGGRYDGLLIDHEYNMLATRKNRPRDIGYLSSGTRDAAFLALRLAISSLLFPDEMPPLIFDDTFAHIDGERLKLLLHNLSLAAGDRQIVLLSCHERELALVPEGARVQNFY